MAGSIPYDGSISAPWADGFKGWLTPTAYFMSLMLATNYGARAWFGGYRWVAIIIMLLLVGGYLVGGFTPSIPK
jgi:hypothetical protein